MSLTVLRVFKQQIHFTILTRLAKIRQEVIKLLKGWINFVVENFHKTFLQQKNVINDGLRALEHLDKFTVLLI